MMKPSENSQEGSCDKGQLQKLTARKVDYKGAPLFKQQGILKVLHVYRTYFPDTQGGLEETVRQICKNTQSQQVCHRIFSLSVDPNPPSIHFPEATVYRFPLNIEVASCGMSLQGIFGFRKLVQWADIVHYHYPWPFGDLLHCICAVKKPCVVSYQSDIVRQKILAKIYHPLQRKFLGSADKIVATSPNYLHSSPVLFRYRKKTIVIPNGLDEGGYPQQKRKKIEDIKKKYGSNFFLFVGVLRYYKGLHYLLEAAKNQNFKVVIIGKGPMEKKLKCQAKMLGLTNVFFVGYVDDPTKYCFLNLAKAVVFPSHERSEAFGMTLIEGAMFSKPLITAEIGTGTTYINCHNKTGLVVPPRDIVALKKAMLLLEKDENFAIKCGYRARQRYEHLFTGRKMGKEYTNVYLDLLQNQ